MIRWFCRAQNVNFATIDIEACPLSSELIMAVPCFTVYEPPQGRAALANVQTLAHTCRARQLDDVVVEFAGENPEHLMTAVRTLAPPACQDRLELSELFRSLWLMCVRCCLAGVAGAAAAG